MVTVERIDRLPVNFQEFVEEIAPGLGDLYGPRACEEYRASAVDTVRATLAHPAVEAFAANASGCAAGLLFTVTRGDIGHVSFLHVLEQYSGQGMERGLVEIGVRSLWAKDVRGVVSECITFGRLELAEPFGALGFRCIPRQLMQASLRGSSLALDSPVTSVPCRSADQPEVAQVIAEAYRSHVDRNLHQEVRTIREAQRFVSRATRGLYGPTRADYTRVVRRGGEMAGAIIGCRVAPEVGFILQVVVRPSYRNQGLGTTLIRELAECFRRTGLERVALGVSVANPARSLYERLSFTVLRPVNAYVCWRKPAGNFRNELRRGGGLL